MTDPPSSSTIYYETTQLLRQSETIQPVWKNKAQEQNEAITPRKKPTWTKQRQQRHNNQHLPPHPPNVPQKQKEEIETKLLMLLGKYVEHKQLERTKHSPLSPRGLTEKLATLISRTKTELVQEYVTEGKHHRKEGRHLHALRSFQHALRIKEQAVPVPVSPVRPRYRKIASIHVRKSPRSTNVAYRHRPPSSPTCSTTQRLSPWTPNFPAWGDDDQDHSSSPAVEWELMESNAPTFSSFFEQKPRSKTMLQQQQQQQPPVIIQRTRRRRRRRKMDKQGTNIVTEVPKYILNFGSLPATTNYRKPIKSQLRFPIFRSKARFEEEDSF